MIHVMWHVTHDMWHVTHRGYWTLSKNVSFLALTVWDGQSFEDISTNHPVSKSPSVWKKSKGGGGHLWIQTFQRTFCCYLCLEIFERGGVSLKSKLVENFFYCCLFLDNFHLTQIKTCWETFFGCLKGRLSWWLPFKHTLRGSVSPVFIHPFWK